MLRDCMSKGLEDDRLRYAQEGDVAAGADSA